MTAGPLTREQLAALAHEQLPKLREVLANQPASVQLDALLLAFVTLATESGLLHQAGTTLLNVGGGIVFQQMLNEASARCSVPASLEADHHAAPPSIQ